MAIRGLAGIRGLGRPRNDFMSIEREPEFRVPSFDYTAPTINEDAINKALEAVTVRKEANDAISNATDQYEADVADFKNTQATEIEQGIATLPEILNLSETPFVPEGIGSFTSLPKTEREIGRENELPYQETIIPRMPNEDFIPFVPPPSIQDLDERDFRDTIGDDFLPTPDIIPATDPVINLPSDDFLTGGEPSINLPVFKGEGGREDFVRDFDDTGFGDYIIEDPIIPPMTPPTEPVIPIDNPYTNIFDLPINIGSIFDIDDEDFYDSIGEPPFDDIIFPPYDPPIIPPDDPPIIPPPDIIIPPPPPTGPINYYTGKPISNPYTPYSTDSGAAPLTRTMNPRTFGQAPGFERKQPEPIIIKPPRIPPPRDDQIFVPPPIDFPEELRPIAMAPTGAKGGGYLNKGISMLPMNGQGDTLTTQVFQSGFRPRR